MTFHATGHRGRPAQQFDGSWAPWWRRRFNAWCRADRGRWRGTTLVFGAVVAGAATLGGALLQRDVAVPGADAVAAAVYLIGAVSAAMLIRRPDGRVDSGLLISALLLSGVSLVPLLWVGPQVWVENYLSTLGATVPAYTVTTAVVAPQGGRVAVGAASVIAAASLLALLM